MFDPAWTVWFLFGHFWPLGTSLGSLCQRTLCCKPDVWFLSNPYETPSVGIFSSETFRVRSRAFDHIWSLPDFNEAGVFTTDLVRSGSSIHSFPHPFCCYYVEPPWISECSWISQSKIMMPCWTALSWLGAGRSSNSATRSNIYFNKLTCPGWTWTSTTRRQTWNRTSNFAFAQLHMRVTAKNKGIARLSNQSQCLVGLEGPSSSSTWLFESCTHFLICGVLCIVLVQLHVLLAMGTNFCCSV